MKNREVSLPDVVLGQCKLQEPLPVRVYLAGHLLLFDAVLARHLGGPWVAGPICQTLQELVGGYLHVLGGETVASVLARLVPTDLIGRPLHQGASYGLHLLARGSARPQDI